jgi:hypothetical protein
LQAQPGWSELNAVFDASGAGILKAAADNGNPDWSYSGLNGGHGEEDGAAIQRLLYGAMQFTPASVVDVLKQNYGMGSNAAIYSRRPLRTDVLDGPEQTNWYNPN